MVAGGAGPGVRIKVFCRTCKGSQTRLEHGMWDPGYTLEEDMGSLGTEWGDGNRTEGTHV